MIVPDQKLVRLNAAFKSAGFNLWFVGGCVRDSLLGHEPNDIDLCTDATPDQQIKIYKTNKISHIPTGLQHGTITAIVSGEKYEITTLRTESNHDGRRADVEYTNSLENDLSRRDLTINAMAQDFDGNLIDPFNGHGDLKYKIVRFVGNPEERMKEDYLRILRYFRFWQRFGSDVDVITGAAIRACVPGLKQISGERIWSEMKKIISHDMSPTALMLMKDMGVMDAIDCGSIYEYRQTSIPAVTLGVSVSAKRVEAVASRWVLSNLERKYMRFANKNLNNKNIDYYKEYLVDGGDLELVECMLEYHELPSLKAWDIPVFPVNGRDMISRGIKNGMAIGIMLKRLRQRWKDSNYTLTKSELLK